VLYLREEAHMTPFVVVLGIVGAVLILVGLVGGGFTLSGSFMPGMGMPKVGNWVRLPCFGVGAVLVVLAIALGFGTNQNTPNPSPTPVAATVAAATPATSASPSPSDTASPREATIISPVYVFAQPSVSSEKVAAVAGGRTVDILCTTQGDDVQNPYTGQSSSLWDGTSDGYIPDAYVDTGTIQATMPSC
jgi:hypothetical protein